MNGRPYRRIDSFYLFEMRLNQFRRRELFLADALRHLLRAEMEHEHIFR